MPSKLSNLVDNLSEINVKINNVKKLIINNNKL